jgi:4-hydroxybenzoyl-CoA reductase subunit alpha
LRGVKAVITGKDYSGIKIGPLRATRDRQLIAIDKVRFVGEGVAAVAAIDEDTADEALELIRVEYEPLTPVFDAEEAMKPGAPRVHDHVERNIALERHWNLGDVEKGFRESDYVKEDTFTYALNMHGFIENHCCLASWDASGKLTVWTPIQLPFHARRDFALILDMPYSKVRVIKPPTGGGFGGKGEPLDFHLAAILLSQKAGKPVVIRVTKKEEFLIGTRRLPVKMWMKIGVKKDGTIMALQSRFISNGGAYTSVGPITIYNHGLAQMLPYRVANFRHDAYRVYTNNPVCGPKRGHGQVQPRFAMDTLLDMVAEDIGLSPIEIKLKNALRPGDKTLNDLRIITSGLPEAITRSAEKAGWEEKWAKRRGTHGIGLGCGGFACGARVAALSDSSAVVKINEDGTIVLLTGISDLGQGCDSIMAMITAEVLGVRLEDVSVVSADTDTCPFDPGSFSSRVTFFAGNATIKAAEDAKKQLAEVAAKKLGVKEEELEFRDRWVYVKQSPERRVSFAELVRAAQVSDSKGVIFGRATWYPPNVEWPDPKNSYRGNISGSYSFSAQVAEVELDRETGQFKLVKVTNGDDCGRQLNPMYAEGQEEGCVSNGQGEMMYEEIVMKDGVAMNPGYTDYKMPRSTDSPQMESMEIITDDPVGPFGAKEIGEGYICSTPGAISGAIHDATGVWIKDVPITAERVFWAMKQKESAARSGQES